MLYAVLKRKRERPQYGSPLLRFPYQHGKCPGYCDITHLHTSMPNIILDSDAQFLDILMLSISELPFQHNPTFINVEL